MHRLGHLGVAFAVAALPTSILFAVIEPGMAVMFSLQTVAMCRIPDQAEWAVPGIPHRAVTHNFVFLLAVNLVTVAFAVVMHLMVSSVISLPIQVYIAVPVGATAGILSHFAADALTKASGKYAVRPFWPFSKWSFRFGLVNSDSWLANGALFVAGGLLYGVCLALGLRAYGLG